MRKKKHLSKSKIRVSAEETLKKDLHETRKRLWDMEHQLYVAKYFIKNFLIPMIKQED